MNPTMAQQFHQVAAAPQTEGSIPPLQVPTITQPLNTMSTQELVAAQAQLAMLSQQVTLQQQQLLQRQASRLQLPILPISQSNVQLPSNQPNLPQAREGGLQMPPQAIIPQSNLPQAQLQHQQPISQVSNILLGQQQQTQQPIPQLSNISQVQGAWLQLPQPISQPSQPQIPLAPLPPILRIQLALNFLQQQQQQKQHAQVQQAQQLYPNLPQQLQMPDLMNQNQGLLGLMANVNPVLVTSANLAASTSAYAMSVAAASAGGGTHSSSSREVRPRNNSKQQKWMARYEELRQFQQVSNTCRGTNSVYCLYKR